LASKINADSRRVFIERTNSTHLYFVLPWNRLLPQYIPLRLWPFILVDANKWTAKAKQGWSVKESHSPLDAVYFLLVKEKCDVLLLNVRRRRIRKHKQFLKDA